MSAFRLQFIIEDNQGDTQYLELWAGSMKSAIDRISSEFDINTDKILHIPTDIEIATLSFSVIDSSMKNGATWEAIKHLDDLLKNEFENIA